MQKKLEMLRCIPGWDSPKGTTDRVTSVTKKLLSIMCGKPWLQKAPVELWEKDNIIPIVKKGKEQDSGMVTVISVLEKIMLSTLLKSISKS